MNVADQDPKGFLSSEWTAAAIGLVGLTLHLWWFVDSYHQGDVLTGLGGFLAALGIYIAAQPYIRKGVVETAREQVGLDNGANSQIKEEEAEQEGVRHVLKERVVGVILIACGSMLNGYGMELARLFSLRGP
jgi:hypothetical protein